jgi:hypothetical protein
MRTRDWRRNKEDLIVLKRLKTLPVSYYRYFADVNGNRSQHTSIYDYIGSSQNHMFKTYTTKKYDSNHKVKYSPNRGRAYWRDLNKKGTKEYYKLELFKILKEYGLK